MYTNYENIKYIIALHSLSFSLRNILMTFQEYAGPAAPAVWYFNCLVVSPHKTAGGRLSF